MRSKLRQLKLLMRRTKFYTLEEHNEKVQELMKTMPNHPIIAYRGRIYELAAELGMSHEDLYKQWKHVEPKNIHLRTDYTKNHTRVRKDNGRSINYGSGGSGVNSLRYPSRKRSHATWARFYKLFPSVAEKDQWNGKTSKRYP